jgi:23S rRNA pseudouridine2605 synthase
MSAINKENQGKSTKPKLQKFLADCGICSRRKGEEMISNAEVTVNGDIARLGARIDPNEDIVKVNGKRIQAFRQDTLTLLVNKPKGFTCSNSDEHAERLIFELLETKHRKFRLFCAGRLDLDSQGLVILTNDGNLAHRLTHPSQKVRKRYQVEINQPLEHEHFSKLLEGFDEGGEFIRLDEIRVKYGNPVGSCKLEIILGHGKKREIRRAFGFFKYRIRKLRRIAIGGLTLGKTPLGHYRELENKEIDLLFPR